MAIRSSLFRLFVSLFLMMVAHSVFAAESLNSVVAIVNKEVITKSEFDAAMSQARQQLAASPNPNSISDSQLSQLIMQQLINRKIQLELAKQAHMTVSDAQVNQALAKIAAQNHISVDALKSKVEQQGIPLQTYLKNIHDQMLLQQVEQSAAGAQVHVTAADIQNALKQYQAHMGNQQMMHVVDINVPTQQQAQQIAMQLKNGKDINAVAPNDTHDLGWQNENTLPDLFLQQLAHMTTGDVVGPIQAPNGYHVLKLLGVRGNKAPTPTKAQLQNIAYQMKMQKAVEKWLETVRKTAYIKIMI